MAKKQETKQQQGNSKANRLNTDEVVPAIVEACLARGGARGEITQVKARILQGKNKGKSMRRNVRGPIKPRDVLMLRETEIEARHLGKRPKRGSQS